MRCHAGKTRYEQTYRSDVVTAQCISITVITTTKASSAVPGKVGGDGSGDGRQSNSDKDGSVEEHRVYETSAPKSTEIAGPGDPW